MDLRDYFIQQYAYVKWADTRCLDAAATVPAEAYHTDFGFSFGTAHNTLVHMLGAQSIWSGRWQGDSGRVFPAGADFATLDAVRRRWAEVHDEVLSFVGRQTEQTLQSDVAYTRRGVPLTGRLWQLLNHCADHANFHRGQFNSLVKRAGGTPAATMYIDYARAHDKQGGRP